MDFKVESLDKVGSFSVELSYIVNDRIRSSAEILINEVPDYFFMKLLLVVVSIIRHLVKERLDFLDILKLLLE